MNYRFQFRRYRLPFRTPLRTSQGPWAVREGVIVQLTDEKGKSSYGEAAPIPWFGTETADEITAACVALGEFADSEAISRLPDSLGCLKAALTTATAAPSAPQHRHVSVAALLPAGRAALDVISPKADAGFRTFKWKVGVLDAADELALLDDVCARLPDGAKVRLDSNGAWDRRKAERWLERCAGRPVEFVEDPCALRRTDSVTDRRRAEDLLMGLARSYPTPIALDEPLTGGGDVARFITQGWRGVFVVKPALLADAPRTLGALALAKADVVFSSALETAIGAKTSLRHALAWSRDARAVGFGVWPLFADSRFDGLHATPFFRAEDIERLDAAAVWKALDET